MNLIANIWSYFNPHQSICHRHQLLIDIIGPHYFDLPVEVWDILYRYYDVFKWMSSKNKKCKITQVRMQISNSSNEISRYHRPSGYEDWNPLQLNIEIFLYLGQILDPCIHCSQFNGSVSKPIKNENHDIFTWDLGVIVDKEEMIYFITLVDTTTLTWSEWKMSNIPIRFFDQKICIIDEDYWLMTTPNVGCYEIECRMKIELK